MSTSKTITLKGFDEARDLLRGMIKKGEDLTPLMQAIGERGGVTPTKRRLATTKKDPQGKEWESLSDDYAYAKAHGIKRVNKAKKPGLSKWLRKPKPGAGLLQYSNALLKSIGSAAGKNRVEWGSNMVYAARHQFGGKGIPARPFLGLAEEDIKVIRSLIKAYFNNANG